MKIPQKIITELEQEGTGLSHGKVILELSYRDFYLSHYKIKREKSEVTLHKGAGDPDTVTNYGIEQTGMRKRCRK